MKTLGDLYISMTTIEYLGTILVSAFFFYLVLRLVGAIWR